MAEQSLRLSLFWNPTLLPGAQLITEDQLKRRALSAQPRFIGQEASRLTTL